MIETGPVPVVTRQRSLATPEELLDDGDRLTNGTWSARKPLIGTLVRGTMVVVPVPQLVPVP